VSLLHVENLGKSFGGVKAVDGIHFELKAGELLALIGPNGAGKSTTFNMVNGQLRADRGSIRWTAPNWWACSRAIWRLGVGRTFQIAATFSSLTVVENVQMALLSQDRKLFSMWRRRHATAAATRWTCWTGGHGRAGRPPLQRAGLWRRQARGAGHGHGQQPQAAADGRAHRRHGAQGAQRADGADQEAGGGARHGRAVHRAQHGRGVRLRRPHGGAGARAPDRRGRAEAIRNDPKVQEVYFGTGKTFEKRGAAQEQAA
jgi:branched-chain amino acid transport system ATP-binding protein